MADKKTTLFELHMHGDAEFGPSILRGGSEEETTDEMDTEMEDEESSGSRIPRVVMALVMLSLIAFGVRKIRGMMGDGEMGELIEVGDDEMEATA